MFSVQDVGYNVKFYEVVIKRGYKYVRVTLNILKILQGRRNGYESGVKKLFVYSTFYSMGVQNKIFLSVINLLLIAILFNSIRVAQQNNNYCTHISDARRTLLHVSNVDNFFSWIITILKQYLFMQCKQTKNIIARKGSRGHHAGNKWIIDVPCCTPSFLKWGICTPHFPLPRGINLICILHRILNSKEVLFI